MFEQFPTKVLTLKNLKRLDLRFMRNKMHQLHTLSIPKEAKVLLPDCEILV